MVVSNLQGAPADQHLYLVVVSREEERFDDFDCRCGGVMAGQPGRTARRSASVDQHIDTEIDVDDDDDSSP